MSERIISEVHPITRMPSLYKRTGIYCRVSSSAVAQLNSLASQASAYVQMFSCRPGFQLVDIYIDVCSGEKKDRREFQRMLNDVSANKLDYVIVKSVSRFGRNTEDIITAIRKFKENNTQLYFEEEDIDTFRIDSELLITIISAYAQAENEARRQNQLWAIRKRAVDGTSELYYRKCYGYKDDEIYGLVIDREKAKVVQMIYEKYLNGYSIVALQKLLKELSVPSPRGKETWNKRSIECILENEKYTGDVIIFKTKAAGEKGHKRATNLDGRKYKGKDCVPAIITKEIFDAVQNERKRRTNIETDENGNHRRKHKYSTKHMDAIL